MKNLTRHLKRYLPDHVAAEGPQLRHWLLLAVLIAGVASIGLLLIATIVIAILSLGLPDVRDFDKLAGSQSTVIYDKEGDVLYTIHGEENRKYIQLDDISEHLRNAVVSIEDDEFYEHSGFDLPAIMMAVLHEAFGIGAQRGGSTITQQLAKNAFLSSERTYTRKLKELVLSVRLERAYDKNEILELYLNRVPFGSNAHGAELAARVYFDKAAHELTLAESAILAGIPNAPTRYSPYGAHGYSHLDVDLTAEQIASRGIKSLGDLNESEYTIGLIGATIQLSGEASIYIPGRADLVLRRMRESGYVTENERKAALEETHTVEFREYRETIRAPHFVFYVRQLLEEEFGKELVEGGGLQVYTTIDPELQDLAEAKVAETIDANAYNAVTNGAAMAVNVKTGHVLAMVGSKDYFNDEIKGKVNMVFAPRQPGSSFKPFVYLQAFLKGYAPATVLYDVRTNFGANYTPDNYDGSFFGPVPIRVAIAQSRNIPAIKAYFLAGQEDEILNLVDQLGISGAKERKPHLGYGPALALGAAEVTMWDMIKGYSIFANEGEQRLYGGLGSAENDFVSILKVETRDGDMLYEYKGSRVRSTEVVDPQATYLISDILSDEAISFGRLQKFRDATGYQVATKTGTSTKEIKKDVIRPSNTWMFGFSPDIVVSSWGGNSDGSPMNLGANGYNVAGPTLHALMTAALKKLDAPTESAPFTPKKTFTRPEGIKEMTVTKMTGKLPGPDTPPDMLRKDLFASFNIPTEYDDTLVRLAVDKTTGDLPHPACDPEYTETRLFQQHKDPITDYPTWEWGIRQWIEEVKAKAAAAGATEVATATPEGAPVLPLNILDFPPKKTRELPPGVDPGNRPNITITNPAAFTQFANGYYSVEVSIDAQNSSIDRVELYLDDLHQFTATTSPFSGNVRITPFTPRGAHTIKAKVFDGCFVGQSAIEIEAVREVESEDGANGDPALE